MQKRIEDYGVKIGELKKGKLNKITDVKGVKVGHCTIDTEDNKTGVTVIIPSDKNVFLNKLVCASFVLNGFGKTGGLVQIDELGTLETPIAFTNTLNVGLVHDAVVEYMIGECRKDGFDVLSINPLICECNDSYLNNIQNRAVKKEHVFKAIENSSEDFEEGDVGAGKGMSCFGLKGGIGSASRIVELDGREYTVGVMVLTNCGLLKDLTIDGKSIGKEIQKKIEAEKVYDTGSIITVIATDIPMSGRQLRRVCRRSSVGLIRLGSYIGNGSGEIIIGFSTANIIEHNCSEDISSIKIINEKEIDKVFRASAESCEEAVLNSMITSETVVGYKGHIRKALKDYFEQVT